MSASTIVATMIMNGPLTSRGAGGSDPPPWWLVLIAAFAGFLLVVMVMNLAHK